jgi:zinc dependent phospholipase C
MPRSIRRGLFFVVLVCGMCRICSGYSVLTHEQIVDLLWADQIKPLLLAKYPGASDEDLRKAHAYAYGGSLIQDMGYYPFGNKTFSDLVHYVRSGDFVIALLTEASDINEYAFALGALTHYAADNIGHPVVNAAVAQEFPKLRAKYGPVVTYAEDKKAHIRTEFGFDVVQVAKERYSSDAYHDFIGFEVSKPVLQRAFFKTYGMKLDDIFGDLDLSIGSFRWAVSRAIPELTKAALLAKKDEMVREDPSFAKNKFLYNLKRSEYEKEWGKKYHKPGLGAKILAAIFKVVPKIGPFRTIAVKMPYPATETRYLKSVNDTLDEYRTFISELKQHKLTLENKDFDTGKQTRPGEYSLTDETYAKLLDKLARAKFSATGEDLRKDILAFYRDPNAPNTTRKHHDKWNKTLLEVEQLKAAQVASASSY